MDATPRTPYNRPSRAGTTLRRFVFTLPNWTQEEYKKISEMECTWMVIGKETCPTTGTLHLQGACILGIQMSFTRVKTLIGSRAHIESMRGKPEDSLAYCSKEDSAPFVKGILPIPGKRSDIKDSVERIIGGESLRDLALDGEGGGAVSIVKWHKGLTILRSLVQPPRSSPPKVFWLFGPTGTGKTRCAFQSGIQLSGIGDTGIWISSGGLRWFDGYDGQPVVIFDDFRTKDVKFAFLLRLLDRYPMAVEFKGGFVNWIPKFIFITAPSTPDDIFATRLHYKPEDMQQLHRRLTKVIELANRLDDGGRQRLVDTIVDLSRDDEENTI